MTWVDQIGFWLKQFVRRRRARARFLQVTADFGLGIIEWWNYPGDLAIAERRTYGNVIVDWDNECARRRSL